MPSPFTVFSPLRENVASALLRVVEERCSVIPRSLSISQPQENQEESFAMKLFRMLVVLLGLAPFLGGYHSIVRADEWDKTTKVTFSEAVQVPGAVLQPGTYILKLADSQSNRHVVQIFNEDHTALITTVLAIPNYRLEPSGKTVLSYDERPADQPVALAAWFYPGDNFGQEFAYPKSRAQELSRLNHREVPSTESEEAYPGQSEQRSATNANPEAVAAQPKTEVPQSEPTPAPTSANREPTPASSVNPEPNASTVQATPRSNATEARQLPQTASLLPLVGLVGFALLGAALVLRLALRG